MIEELIQSQPESAVLSFLLVSPPRSFSQTELSKRLSLGPARLHPALLRLSRHGHIKSFTKNGVKYFSLNPKQQVLPHLKAALLRGRKPFEDELYSAIKKLGKIKAAFLSGLFVGSPDLPVDLLLVGSISPKRMSVFLEGCERMTGNELNYCVMSEKEFKLRKDTFDRFIKDIFDYPYLTVVDTITHSK